MKSKVALLSGMCLVLTYLTGCTTYVAQTGKMTDAWKAGDVQGAATQFAAKAEKEKAGKDQVIWRLEQAGALRAAGKWEESTAAFEAAEERINWHDEQAKISVTQETLAFFSNQATLPYEGRDYDKILLNTYKALNFLQAGQPDKARVELVRAYQRQQDAIENNKRRIARVEEAAEKAKQNPKDKTGIEMAEKAKNDAAFQGKVQNCVQNLDGLKVYEDYANPFTVYMDGLFFMTAATGGPDLERSRKSFERTLAFTGENKFVKQDLDAVDKVIAGSPIPPTVYVIFETGCAPIRDQIQIPVPLFLAGVKEVPYIVAAFPVLKPQDGHLATLNVTADGATESTVLLSSMDGVVGHAFKNELPTIITKTLTAATIRAAAQYGVNKGTEKQDAMAKIMIKVTMAVIEHLTQIADTRTWTTLPKEFQFCRIPMPVDRKVQLSGPGGEAKTEVTLEDSVVTLLYVKSTSANCPLLVSQIKLKPASSEIALNTAASGAPGSR